jgi:ATP-binding cassette subfamily B protein
LTTLAHADAVLVLEGGRVVERGTHAELIAAGGAYRRLWAIQSSIADDVGRDRSGSAGVRPVEMKEAAS